MRARASSIAVRCAGGKGHREPCGRPSGERSADLRVSEVDPAGGEERRDRVRRAVRAEGVLVVAFSHPVVPRGEARIRVQLSAAHVDADIDRAVAAFVAARAGLSGGC